MTTGLGRVSGERKEGERGGERGDAEGEVADEHGGVGEGGGGEGEEVDADGEAVGEWGGRGGLGGLEDGRDVEVVNHLGFDAVVRLGAGNEELEAVQVVGVPAWGEQKGTGKCKGE